MEVLPLHRGRVTREREHVLLKGDNDLEVSHRWENAGLRKVPPHLPALLEAFFAVTGTRFESVDVRTLYKAVVLLVTEKLTGIR